MTEPQDKAEAKWVEKHTEHEYRKTATIKAVQFDGSMCLIEKFNITPPMPFDPAYTMPTKEGEMELGISDWIATGVEGEHWAIRNTVFKETYERVEEQKIKSVYVVQMPSRRFIRTTYDSKANERIVGKFVKTIRQASMFYNQDTAQRIADEWNGRVIALVPTVVGGDTD